MPMSDDTRHKFIMAFTVFSILLLFFITIMAVNSNVDAKIELRYAAYCKITGNPDRLTLGEWTEIRHHLSWDKPEEK